jgi:hypothetical protein
MGFVVIFQGHGYSLKGKDKAKERASEKEAV